MKLPIQALPIMRKVRTSNALMSGITASEACDMAKCGPVIGGCAISALIGGLPAAAGCLATAGITGCRDCVGEVLQAAADAGLGGGTNIPV